MGRTKKYQSNAERQRAYRQRKQRQRDAIVTLQNMQIDAPALRYHGGKWSLAKWIMQHFPEHACYVEPYAGGASVMLQKDPAKHDVLNDLDGDVVNFFCVLRTREAELIRAITLTPYSRQEQKEAWEPTDDPLERARRFYVRSWQSFASPTSNGWSTGWRYKKSSTSYPMVSTWNRTDHLWAVAARLKHVHIDQDDALSVIKRYDTPDTLFYVDPPYVWETRGKWAGRAYRHEMDNDQHVDLAGALNEVCGYVVLSGYETALYSELYPGWSIHRKKANVLSGEDKMECIWLSPRTVAKLESENAPSNAAVQLDLV